MAQPALKPVPSFDTGRTIKSFTDANIDQATAEAITEGLDNALQHTATKVEMHALHKETKSDLEFLRQEMVGKVVEVNNNINLLRKDMEKSEIKTEAEFKLVYEKIDSSKKTTIIAFGGMMIVGFSLVIGAIAIATNILLTAGAVG